MQPGEKLKSGQLRDAFSPAGSLARSQSPTAAGRRQLRQTPSPFKENVLKRFKSGDSLGDAVERQLSEDIAEFGQGSLKYSVDLA